MRDSRYLVLGALLILAVLGSQFRIAKITIKEPSGPRTTYRLCFPGRQPDVFGMTDKDFMCHIYEWYGFRHLGGFGKATQDPDEADQLKANTNRTAQSPLRASALVIPDERDRQVLETLLMHLLADSNFDMTRVSTNGATVVLHTRTPEKTGFLMSHQIRSDIGDRILPSEVGDDLRRRNTPADAKPDTYDSVTAFYTNLTFAAEIVVTDLTEMWGQRRSFVSFEEAHPNARGWLEPYLPGFSKDGTRAVVRAGVGPWAHAAMLTAVIERSGDRWAVKWYHISCYA